MHVCLALWQQLRYGGAVRTQTRTFFGRIFVNDTVWVRCDFGMKGLIIVPQVLYLLVLLYCFGGSVSQN